MNRILIFQFDPNYMEVEYAVPIEDGKNAFLEIRELARARYADRILPIDVRFTATDGAYLSPYQGGAKVVISVATDPTDDCMTVLDDFEAILASHGGRPHWGKLHSLTPATMAQLYPELEKFKDIRKSLDPEGVFLNDHLRELFA